jgi:hypothetical protein
MSDKPSKTSLGSHGSDARSAAVVAGVPSHKKRLKTHGPNVQAKPELAGHTEDGEALIRLPAHDRRMRTQPSLALRNKAAAGAGGAAAATPDLARENLEDPDEKITAKKIQIDRSEKITAKNIRIDPAKSSANGPGGAGAKSQVEKITERGLGPRTSSIPPPYEPGDLDTDGHASPSSGGANAREAHSSSPPSSPPSPDYSLDKRARVWRWRHVRALELALRWR